jgi:hypothetical protein
MTIVEVTLLVYVQKCDSKDFVSLTTHSERPNHVLAIGDAQWVFVDAVKEAQSPYHASQYL